MECSPKILIVDDEPRMCESLGLLLGQQGYEIHTATSGVEAQRTLSRQVFDLALLDMVMPDMGGHTLMEYIKTRAPETYVIFITGNASIDSALGALRNGAYDYLRKPIEYEELLKTVQNALDQKRLRSEREIIGGKLELSEERYRYLVQNSPDIIYTLDREGNFTFVSDAVKRLLGYDRKQLIGSHYTTILWDEDREKANWLLGEKRTGERASSGVELRMKGPTDAEHFRFFEVKHLTIEDPSGSPVNGNEKLLGTHGVARDVSDRKRLEAQLQQAQKMEAVGTLAGGIAHDFNNLLMGIQGYTSLMLLKIDSAHPHYQKLKSIEQYIQSGAELTKQLLGFARGGKYDVKPVDLNELAGKTSQMFGRTKKEIVIHENHEQGIWPVDADEGQIEQVLLNLYLNAWQAMPGGGDLHITTRNTVLDKGSARPFNLTPGRYVQLSVIDNGYGMDEKTQQRIFEPFFTTKKMGRGNGLGLASAYGIVKNHNGIIDVQSQKGKGTTFSIYLPASRREVKKEKGAPPRIFNGEGHEGVLFIDDEEMIKDVGTEILKALGYQVFSASSGLEAVETFKENREKIHAVILDMIMPGMGGGEIFDALIAIDPEVKVLLSSGYSVDGEASEILKRGCKGFIQKPFDIISLSKKLREVLAEAPDEMKKTA
jgi:two-component system, cell cycle sensor histidine kinase and response regulator CckA